MSEQQKHNSSEAESREVAEASRQKEWRKPSFMKELFLGNLRMDMIDPFPEFNTPDRAEFVEFSEKLKAYLLSDIDPLEIDATGEFPKDVVEKLAGLGALGMNMPKEYEGLGFSKYEYCKTMALSGSYEGSLMGFLSPHQSVGVPECVKLFGTAEQKKEFLPRCANGAISAFALTENDVGSDPARLATSLEDDPDGEHYLLNGTKLWCTNGTCAELLVVMARHKSNDKISALIVETKTPGVEVTHRCRFMGLSALQNGVIEFKNVKVPKKNIIGKEGMGLKIALTALTTGRLSVPYGVLGAAKKALEVSRIWGNEREQWGKALGKHEAISHKIADMATKIFGMESIILLACRMADSGKFDIRLESAAAKEWNTCRMWEIMDDTMQIRGGRGYEKETSLRARGERPMPVERMMRDLRVSKIFEGASEIMHLLMAREAVDKHLQVAGAMVDPKSSAGTKLAALPGILSFYAWWYPSRFITPRGWFGYSKYGTMAPHVRFIDRASKKLARQAFHGMLMYQAKLERKQAFLFRWVDIAMELFVMSASVSRLHAMWDANDPNLDDTRRLVELLCWNSRRKINQLFYDLWHNDDDLKTNIANDILDGRFTMLEDGIITLDEAEAAEQAKGQGGGAAFDSIPNVEQEVDATSPSRYL